MQIAEQVESVVFEIECFDPDEFDEFRDMMSWISKNCKNGRVHFDLNGGILTGDQQLMWMHGRITFTNDKDGSDAVAFKLRWL